MHIKISPKDYPCQIVINGKTLGPDYPYRYQNLDINYQVINIGDKVKRAAKAPAYCSLPEKTVFTVSKYVFGSECWWIPNKDLDNVVVGLEFVESKTQGATWFGEHLEKV